ncbi:MAG: DNA repair protein RecO C-terminal domain-containing protein [Paramuribaculum sp.]|nr:DNA repair protein RecO C-terminal domain-containing protein [Paramuribaculum sp.]
MQLIPLRIIRYSDKHSILSAYTRDSGRLAFLIPEGSGKGIARRRAMFQPLFPIEGVVETIPGREFGRIKEPRPIFAAYSLITNPVKQTLALFLSEVLSSLLRHPEPDHRLFDFMVESIKLLEVLPTDRIGNFHIMFLYRLADFFGIAPDTGSYSTGDIFDMKDAIFRKTAPLHSDYLPAESASLLTQLERLGYRTMHLLKLSRGQRYEILESIIRYYELHDFPIHPLKSLPVLASLF